MADFLSSPVTETEERMARAIRKARDFDPDTLYQHLGDDYPVDSTDSEGRTFYRSWRKELPSVRAVLAELGTSVHAQTGQEPVAYQFRQRSAVGKGPQCSLPWCDWVCIEREDYDLYIRHPNKLVQVRPLFALADTSTLGNSK